MRGRPSKAEWKCYLGARGAAGDAVGAVVIGVGDVLLGEDADRNIDRRAVAAEHVGAAEEVEEATTLLAVAAGDLALAVVVAVALLLGLLDGDGRDVGRLASATRLGHSQGGGGEAGEGEGDDAGGVHFEFGFWAGRTPKE